MTKLRDSYDPFDIPVDSSGVFKVSDHILALEVAEEVPWENRDAPEAQSDYERRKRERFSIPKVSLRIRLQRFLNDLVQKISGSRLWQVSMVAIALFSVAMIWYSANYRLQSIDDAYGDLTDLGAVQTELLRVKEQWSAEQMNELANNVASADQRRVFRDYQGLALWLREKGKYAEQLELGFSYTLGGAVPSRIDDMYELPIDITLSSVEGATTSSYLSMLEFLRRTVSTLYYVEIVSAGLQSEGAGVTQTQATLRVWVHSQVSADE
ncbi:MAG: hypothetical protein AAAFM81_13755 [Pseudomonadota bacterium]